MTNEIIPQFQVRAVYDNRVIRIYQAYGDAIADAALSAGTFISPPFSMTRMTWIKTSFLWMMYRAGWGLKDAGQNRILAIDISREGFEWALENSCPTRRSPEMTQEDWENSKQKFPVRIQWDPERDLLLNPLPHRAIQLGLGGDSVPRYVNDWIVRITEITSLAREIHDHVEKGQLTEAQKKLPQERPYSPRFLPGTDAPH